MKTGSREACRGQIIVLMAVVLVALLGFVALAVDGGLIYSDRRNAQNAAAMAGAGMVAQFLENQGVIYDNFNCSNPDVVSAMNIAKDHSIASAIKNNFSIDSDLINKNGVSVTCEVQNTGSFLEQSIFVKVMITVPTNTSFAQLFYTGPVANTVEAITRVHPRTNLGFGYAVATLGSDCVTGGISAEGNVNIQTTHGGLFSNSCMVYSGNVVVQVDDPLESGIRYYSTLTEVGSVDISPTPLQSPIQISPYFVPPPDCAALPSYGDVLVDSTAITTIDPGQYDNLTIEGYAQVIFNPGLYCFSGDLVITAGQIITGNEVTLYFLDGGFLSTANSTINLTAPVVDRPPAIRGMLIYAAVDNTSTFTITGNSDSLYRGTVYIPAGVINSIGNSSMTGLQSQYIAKKVTLSGNTDINIEFDGAYNYQIPATLELYK